jgi:nitrogen fixation protein FixH
MSAGSDRPLTGRRVLLIAVSAFAVVFAANMALLFSATGTFPGLVVKNSYVAGQGWDARAAAQRALGWQTSVGYADGALRARVTDADGRTVEDLALAVMVGRPASDATDRSLTLAARDGLYEAPVALGPGLWQVTLKTTGEGAPAYTAIADLFIPEPR